MPQAKQYKKGSIIYFESESKTKYAYLLKQGVCEREKLNLETFLPQRTRIKEGEFFGIKSALGVPARDETVSVLSDSLVYIFSPQEFEALIVKTIGIILKMLKNFSNELRHIHYAIEKVIGKGDSAGLEDAGTNLFETAVYYFEKRRFDMALYGFKKFIEQYPSDQRCKEAKDYVNQSEEFMGNGGDEDNVDGGNGEIIVEEPSHLSAAETSFPVRDSSPVSTDKLVLFETMESFSPVPDVDKHASLFNSLSDCYGSGNFDEAWKIYNSIQSVVGDEVGDGVVYEKTALAGVRLLFYKKEYNKTVEAAKKFLGMYPRSSFINDALICIAESYVAMNSSANGKAVYQKILSGKVNPDLKNSLLNRVSELGE